MAAPVTPLVNVLVTVNIHPREPPAPLAAPMEPPAPLAGEMAIGLHVHDGGGAPFAVPKPMGMPAPFAVPTGPPALHPDVAKAAAQAKRHANACQKAATKCCMVLAEMREIANAAQQIQDTCSWHRQVTQACADDAANAAIHCLDAHTNMRRMDARWRLNSPCVFSSAPAIPLMDIDRTGGVPGRRLLVSVRSRSASRSSTRM